MQDNVTDQPFTSDQSSGQDAAAPAPSITSLDSLSEFEFQGEKYTPERLQEVFKGYQSAGELQRSSQQEERYWANLDSDLESVAADPSLVAKFKSIYPQKFHSIVDRFVSRSSQGQSQPNSNIPKEFLNEFGQLKSGYQTMRQQLEQMAVESANAKLDSILPKLYEKFPLAVEDAVLARAEAFLSQGGKMTQQAWERFAKESHESVEKKADSHYQKKLQAQMEKNKAGADVGPGGSPPGKAPVQPRTFEQARAAYTAHLKSSGLT